MSNRIIAILLALGFGVLLAGSAGAKKSEPAPPEGGKSKKEPFYRRYLIPGNPLDEKIKSQEKLVEADPKSASLRNDFGNLLALRRFPKEAREQYEIAMKLDKNNYLAPYNLGIVYETEGKISRAIRAYERAVDRNRGFPPGLFRLGHLYEKRGWDRQAIEAYAKALRIDPQMRDPRHNPLVVDTQLLDRVSLTNYERDIATASLSFDARYAEEWRFRRLPYDRAIYSEDLEEAAPTSPESSTTPAFPRSPAPIPAAPGQTRPQAIAPGPGAEAIGAPPTAPPGVPPQPPAGSGGRVLPPGVPVFVSTPTPLPLISPIPPPPTPEGPTPTPTE